jgi:hypothetical protein
MKIWRVKQNGNQYSIDIGNIIIPCQIGKNGLIASKLKREGDLSTPIGKWKLQSLYYRQDKFNYIDKTIKKKFQLLKSLSCVDGATIPIVLFIIKKS